MYSKRICAPSPAVSPFRPRTLFILSCLSSVGTRITLFLFSRQLEGRSVLNMDLCPVSSRPAVPTLYSIYAFLFEVRGVACRFLPFYSSVGGTKTSDMKGLGDTKGKVS